MGQAVVGTGRAVEEAAEAGTAALAVGTGPALVGQAVVGQAVAGTGLAVEEAPEAGTAAVAVGTGPALVGPAVVGQAVAVGTGQLLSRRRAACPTNQQCARETTRPYAAATTTRTPIGAKPGRRASLGRPLARAVAAAEVEEVGAAVGTLPRSLVEEAAEAGAAAVAVGTGPALVGQAVVGQAVAVGTGQPLSRRRAACPTNQQCARETTRPYAAATTTRTPIGAKPGRRASLGRPLARAVAAAEVEEVGAAVGTLPRSLVEEAAEAGAAAVAVGTGPALVGQAVVGQAVVGQAVMVGTGQPLSRRRAACPTIQQCARQTTRPCAAATTTRTPIGAQPGLRASSGRPLVRAVAAAVLAAAEEARM